MSDPVRTWLIEPERFDRANLVSTTAVNIPSLWTAGSYSAGQTVLRLITPQRGWMAGIAMLRVFEALTTTTEDPATSAQWLDIGPANTDAMFTGRLREVTTSWVPVAPGGEPPPTELTVKVTAQKWVNAVYLGGLVAETATLTIRSAAGVVRQTHTRSLITRRVTDWLQFFVAPFGQLQQVVFFPVTALATDTIELKLEGGAQIGRFFWGNALDIGHSPNYGAGVSIDDYTSDLADEFGRTEPAKGVYATRQSLECWHAKPEGNAIFNRAKRLVGVPSVLLANADDSDYAEMLINYGSLMDPQFSVAFPTANIFTFEFKGYT